MKLHQSIRYLPSSFPESDVRHDGQYDHRPSRLSSKLRYFSFPGQRATGPRLENLFAREGCQIGSPEFTDEVSDILKGIEMILLIFKEVLE